MRNMKTEKVILTENLDNLGSLGDEVEVKAGYARNYLFPQKKALPISSVNAKQMRHYKTILAKKVEEAIQANRSLAEKLEAAEVVFAMKAGESGKLFGSVTSKHIVDALQEQGIELDRKFLSLAHAIKTLGSHVVPVKLHSAVSCEIKVKVTAIETVKEEKIEVPPESPSSDEIEAATDQEIGDHDEESGVVA